VWKPSSSRYGVQAGLLVVVGHDARARGERRLDPRLSLEPALDRLLRQQPAPSITCGFDGVRAARDRGDHDGAVAQLDLLAVDLGARRVCLRALGRRDRRRLGIRVRLVGAGLLEDGGVAGGERVRHAAVESAVPVPVAEAREGVEERVLRVGQRHAVLRPPRSREARLHRRQVELDDQ
jgi:hypothetical protein